MKDKILEIVKMVLGDETGISTSMNDCPEWSSLKTIQIVMALEDSGIKLPIEKMPNIHSVQDIINFAYQE